MSASILYIFLHASDYQRADTSRATVHLDSQHADASRATVHLDSQRADASRAIVHLDSQRADTSRASCIEILSALTLPVQLSIWIFAWLKLPVNC